MAEVRWFGSNLDSAGVFPGFGLRPPDSAGACGGPPGRRLRGQLPGGISDMFLVLDFTPSSDTIDPRAVTLGIIWPIQALLREKETLSCRSNH